MNADLLFRTGPFYFVFCLITLSAQAGAGPKPPTVSVVTDPSGNLLEPTNFFQQNTNLWLPLVPGRGGGSGRPEVPTSPTGPNTLFVAVGGNDETAQKGRPDLPWASFSLAAADASSNDVVQLGPGSFYFDKVDLNPYVRVNGSGMGVTYLLGTNTSIYDYWIALTNGSWLGNLTLTKGTTGFAFLYPIVCGPRADPAGADPITNVTLVSVEVIGDSDTFSPNGDTFIDVWNSKFVSSWDCFTCKYGTNGLIRFFNCYSLAFLNGETSPDWPDYNVGGDLSCFLPATGTIEIFGGAAICTNALGQSSPVANNGNASILLSGVYLENTPNSTNALNAPGQPAYYLAAGGGLTIIGHPYPQSRVYQAIYTGDATNDFSSGAFLGVNSDGERAWSSDGSHLTNLDLTTAIGTPTNLVVYGAGGSALVAQDGLKVLNRSTGKGLSISNGVATATGMVAANVLQSTTAVYAASAVFSNTVVVGGPMTVDESLKVGQGLSAQGTITALRGIATVGSNRSALLSSNVTTSPYLWTNTLGQNVVVYLYEGTNTGIGINGTFIGAMTNILIQVQLQPWEWLSVTNTGAGPRLTFKPL